MNPKWPTGRSFANAMDGSCMFAVAVGSLEGAHRFTNCNTWSEPEPAAAWSDFALMNLSPCYELSDDFLIFPARGQLLVLCCCFCCSPIRSMRDAKNPSWRTWRQIQSPNVVSITCAGRAGIQTHFSNLYFKKLKKIILFLSRNAQLFSKVHRGMILI